MYHSTIFIVLILRFFSSFLTDRTQQNNQPIAPTPKIEEAPVSQEIKSPTQSPVKVVPEQSPVKVVPEQSPKPKVEANSAEKSLTSPEKKIMCRICSSSHLDENRLHIHLIMFHFKVCFCNSG